MTATLKAAQSTNDFKPEESLSSRQLSSDGNLHALGRSSSINFSPTSFPQSRGLFTTPSFPSVNSLPSMAMNASVSRRHPGFYVVRHALPKQGTVGSWSAGASRAGDGNANIFEASEELSQQYLQRVHLSMHRVQVTTTGALHLPVVGRSRCPKRCGLHEWACTAFATVVPSSSSSSSPRQQRRRLDLEAGYLSGVMAVLRASLTCPESCMLPAWFSAKSRAVTASLLQ